MQKIIISLLCFNILFLSCNDKQESAYSISEQDKVSVLNSEILIQGSPTRFFFNIEVKKDFFLVSDYSNDTILSIYKNDQVDKPFASYLRKDKGGDFMNLEFAKSDDSVKIHSDKCILIDNRTYVRELSFDDQNDEVSINSYPLPDHLIHSSYYNFTSTDIYAVPSFNNADALFYLFGNHKYYWVAPPLIHDEKRSISNLYLNSLCVNESKNTVVAGMRFINQILFYDLDGMLKTSVILGDSICLPTVKKDTEVDIPNSTNYIIDIYGTPQYVYCLYDGTADFKGVSYIYVFTWNGKHIRTLKTKENLKRIAVDKNNTYILAIAANEGDKRDIVRFSLKK